MSCVSITIAGVIVNANHCFMCTTANVQRMQIAVAAFGESPRLGVAGFFVVVIDQPLEERARSCGLQLAKIHYSTYNESFMLTFATQDEADRSVY